MKAIDTTYVAIGALWLLLGMVLGITMGATEHFLFMPVHARRPRRRLAALSASAAYSAAAARFGSTQFGRT